MTDFEKAHEFTAQWEGGYVHHPSDPGGETNLGITKNVWLDWCRERKLAIKPMKALKPADVLPLYRAKYWQRLAVGLPWPLSAAIYDMSVNHGVGDGDPTDEGGDEAGATWMLWRAWQRCPYGTPLEQALAACDAREEFYKGIVRRKPSQHVFMKGWMRRVNAQREWLKANAQPVTPNVFMRTPAGANVVWDGKPTIYGGQPITVAWVSQMALVYPPGSKTTVDGVRLEVYPDGALQLDRV